MLPSLEVRTDRLGPPLEDAVAEMPSDPFPEAADDETPYSTVRAACP